MIFANVTDISIPEGNVIKIHETNGGRVLWEKKKKVLSAHWEVETFDDNLHFQDIIDIGTEIIISSSYPSATEGIAYYKYNPQDKNIVEKHNILPKHSCYDTLLCLDTKRKNWFLFSNARIIYSNIFTDIDKYKQYDIGLNSDDMGIRTNSCCYSPDLNLICLLYDKIALTFNPTNGDVLNTNIISDKFDILGDNPQNDIAWSPQANRFVFCRTFGIGTNSPEYRGVAVSSNGLTWNVHLYADILGLEDVNHASITYNSNIQAFILAVNMFYKKYVYIYISYDGVTYNKIKELEFQSTPAYVAITYSPEKNITMLLCTNGTYISQDIMNWIPVTNWIPATTDFKLGHNGQRCIWSPTANAFLYVKYDNNIAKLIID